MRTPAGYHIVSNGTDFFGIDENGTWRGPKRHRQDESVGDAVLHSRHVWPPPDMIEGWCYHVDDCQRSIGQGYVISAGQVGLTFPSKVHLLDDGKTMSFRSGEERVPTEVVASMVDIAARIKDPQFSNRAIVHQGIGPIGVTQIPIKNRLYELADANEDEDVTSGNPWERR